jgi:hypothetical protein
MAHQQQYTPPRGFVAPGTPAWQSMPSAVRFAVWLWAVATIVSFTGGAVIAVFMFLAYAAGQS